jgi:hypothetical protein
MPAVDPLQTLSYGLMRATPGSGAAYLSTLQKPGPVKLGKDDRLLDPSNYKTIVGPSDASEDKDVTFLKLVHGDGTPAYFAALKDLANKKTTHQPATQQINYGTPQPAINPKTGKIELVRPDSKGGMNFTGVEPPPQHRDTKVPAEIQRMNIASDTMGQMLDRYEAMLEKYSPRDPLVQGNPAIRAEFQSLMKGIQLQFKEVQALGALTGPDVAIMEAAITDPFTFKGAIYGREGLRGQIKQARQLLKERRGATDEAIGKADGPKEDNDPLGLRK